MSEPITLTERPELDALIAAAVAVAEAMSPEERAAMMEAQRQYEAAARLITVAQEMASTLLELV